MEPWATSQGESVVTDEPNNPIDEPSETPEPVVTESGVGEAEAAPSSATATEAVETPAEGEAVETPAQGEAPETATAAEQAQAPVESPALDVPADVGASEPSVETEAAAPKEPSDEAPSEEPVEVGATAESPKAAKVSKAAKARKAAKAPKSVEKQEKQEKQEEEGEKSEEEKSENMDWYILKVQSNREDSIRDGLLRRVAIAGLGRFFGEIIVPTEQVTEFKGGKKRVSKRKLYPGYLVVQMEINDDSWFLVRETPGIGDFTGPTGHPTPMLPHEVSRILAKKEEEGEESPKVKIPFLSGDQVKIIEGTFENFEGEVHTIDEANGRVTVMINIFGRSTPVELEYWQIESI